MRVFTGVAELEDAVGRPLGVSPWHELTQGRVLDFADVTEDHNWLHTSPERAAASPFGGTIAHGYLTLALTSAFAEEIYRVDGVSTRVNYGLNRVRFVRPVVVGSMVRGHAVLRDVERRRDAFLMSVGMTIEASLDGGEPAEVCIAETLTYLIE